MISTPISMLHINTERTWRGGEQQTFHLVEALAQRGHAITLACRMGSALHERAGALPVELLPMNVHGELDPIAMVNLARAIRNREHDIIHMHTSHAHTLGCAGASLARRGRCVVTRRVAFSTRRTVLSVWKYRWNVARYVAISQAVKDAMVRDGISPGRITVVHSCVDPNLTVPCHSEDIRAELDLDPGSHLVGNVAHMAENKGQCELVRAMPLVLEKVPSAHLVVVGAGPLRNELGALTAHLDIERSVTFTGFRSDVPRFMRSFDVFVMPSHMEGLCTSVLDAMACGAPVIATNVGGIPEIVVDGVNGILVPPEQPESLAEAIAGILTDRDLAARFAGAGRDAVAKTFSIQSMVEGNLTVYQELLCSTG